MSDLSGILLLDKPQGITSARAVAVVKRVLGGPKVGHLGTLDPYASGLLPLCVGEGTKLAPYLADADKGYTGVVRLGVRTDTLDGTGTVLSQTEPPAAADLDLAALAAALTGPLEQVPPAFSAIKKRGVPMYKLARAGRAPELEPRAVVVHSLRLTAVAAGRLRLEARCSKGTYVRALARDLGEAIGCGAILEELVRTEFGRFRLDQAVALERLEAAGGAERAAAALIGPAAALSHLPTIVVDAAAARRLRTGQQAALAHLELASGTVDRSGGGAVRVVDGGERLVAVVRPSGQSWRLDRVFRAPEPCAPGTPVLEAER